MAVLFLRLQVYPLHSTVTLEEQNGVFLVPVPGCRKVGSMYGAERCSWCSRCPFPAAGR